MIFKLEFLISLTVQKKKLSNFKNSLAAQYKTVIGKDIRLPRAVFQASFNRGCNHRPSSERYSTNASGQ
jgi:hypothetical protein